MFASGKIQSVVVKLVFGNLSILVPRYSYRWFFACNKFDCLETHLWDWCSYRVISDLRSAVSKHIPRESWATFAIAFLIVSNLSSTAILQFLPRTDGCCLLNARIGNLKIKLYPVVGLRAVEFFYSEHLALNGQFIRFQIFLLGLKWLQQLFEIFCDPFFLNHINLCLLSCFWIGLPRIVTFIYVFFAEVFALTWFLLSRVRWVVAQTHDKLRHDK